MQNGGAALQLDLARFRQAPPRPATLRAVDDGEVLYVSSHNVPLHFAPPLLLLAEAAVFNPVPVAAAVYSDRGGPVPPLPPLPP